MTAPPSPREHPIMDRADPRGEVVAVHRLFEEVELAGHADRAYVFHRKSMCLHP